MVALIVVGWVEEFNGGKNHVCTTEKIDIGCWSLLAGKPCDDINNNNVLCIILRLYAIIVDG